MGRDTESVTLIIPCFWASAELVEMTIRCLNSLNNTTNKQPEEVLIIDDGSPYEAELIDETDFIQQFRTLRRETNGGYAGAVNMGLYHSTGDIIIVCNNDCEFIQPDWLKHLLKPLKVGYDISSIRTTDSDGWFTKDKIAQGDKFGSLWAMKRKVYEILGGLDESYGNYFEDLDYHRRAEQHGFKIGKNHAGLVHHEGKATFKVVDPDDSSFKQARARFIAKWGEDKL